MAHGLAPNLLGRDFTAEQLNEKWVSDTTALWTAEGWLSVTVLLDLSSRLVVGWPMGANNDEELVARALVWPWFDDDLLRSYPHVIRRWYRPIEQRCRQCHLRLREAMTLTRRTVITLEGVIKFNHAGYRYPDVDCPGHQGTYRSPVADALALPHFTFGLDSVLLVRRLHLGRHQTVDEVHEELLERRRLLGVSISHREMLYLFEAYCTLLRASSEVRDDWQWLSEVNKNGGIIVSVDGIGVCGYMLPC